MIELIIFVGIPLLLLLVGLSIGTLTERRHLRDLARREQAVRVVVTNWRQFAPGAQASPAPTMLVGEVVIATDYFKTFAATLKKIVGGELKTYEAMLARARREAMLRLQEQAQQQGFNALCNVRLDTANVGGVGGGGGGKAKATMAAVLASATAFRSQSPAATHPSAAATQSIVGEGHG